MTSLLSVKSAENVSSPGKKEAKQSYFRGCKEFKVNGKIYYVGTSFGKSAKIDQIKKMMKLCGSDETSFIVEGVKPVKTNKTKVYDI